MTTILKGIKLSEYEMRDPKVQRFKHWNKIFKNTADFEKRMKKIYTHILLPAFPASSVW